MQNRELTTEFMTEQRERLLRMRKDFANHDDVASVTNPAGSNPGMLNFNRLRIGDIDRALQKIDDGTYGLSDESGEPIPQARLEVFPDALYTEREQEEREVGK
ncbi:TraR/DksA family transcriptional regulator [Caballeronia sp. GAWG1-1]|uniref:TraR/DksA family transcriptional regulator n=1 Tax=Caballeronia sp. GAWG1-1 TaxID=2921742 RepID=UPI002028320E|nr:TraR/DksA family transcriptional regulator [Caballeronia sp. GAWG1-1]